MEEEVEYAKEKMAEVADVEAAAVHGTKKEDGEDGAAMIRRANRRELIQWR